MPMKRGKIILACVLALQFTDANSSLYAGDIVVIANPSAGINQLQKEDLVRIFLAKTRTYPNEKPVTAYSQREDSEVRQHFEAAVMEKSPMQIKAYWTRLLFTGRGNPPPALESDREILETVRKDPAAIGYVKASNADNSVKTVFILKD